jgi:hypothetical protein
MSLNREFLIWKEKWCERGEREGGVRERRERGRGVREGGVRERKGAGERESGGPAGRHI